MSTTRHMTEADLLAVPDDSFRRELDGEDVVPGFRCRLADIVTMT